MQSAAPEEIAGVLEDAQSIIVIPGYGMAVAQAQHKVRELYDQSEPQGREREIRDSSGRRPHARAHERAACRGGDSVRQARGDGRDQWGIRRRRDVALVIGANDVVNPAARHDKSSPIYGMPILNADKAQTVVAIKRSMNPGFAGIENELYTLDQRLMLFGDAKAVIAATSKELGDGKH